APAKPWAPDTGDTAWMLTSMALVLMMMVPGLGLFYGGMVRGKNIISVMAQTFAIAGILTVLWMIAGYSLAFTSNASDGMNKFIGGTSNFLLAAVKPDSHSALAGTIPESVFICFQMTFAIITPALIIGAFAERMKFSAVLLFMSLWLLAVYAPVAHWVWGGGFLGGLGVLDFAGGTVVHINAGISGLVCCLVLGKRKGYGTDNMAPTNVLLTAVGAALLWVGWFGFNAGSALGAGTLAGAAMMSTQIATGAALATWMFIEWIHRKKPTLLGMASGAIAGLVAITPACGFVNPTGALTIGLVAGVVCYGGAVFLKHAFGYDDSLDVWGVHGIGGIAGALLTGVLADPSVNSLAQGHSIVKQAIGVSATLLWAGLVSLVILLICKFTTGLRVAEEAELEGLNLASHGETLHP
ncbi:MAG TPA: ammonium transporter, partial [Phenylobacterium sp.]|uniref:ammonium transporter n=1 Tax=Phenylobacterium sp. TaxID=1871053 RepID=UPI002B47D253